MLFEVSSDKEKGLRRQLNEKFFRADEAIVFADTEEDLMWGRAGALSSRSQRNFGRGREDRDEFPGEPTSHLVQRQYLEAAGLAEHVASPTVTNNDVVHTW